MTISGPMPAASPIVMAMMGRVMRCAPQRMGFLHREAFHRPSAPATSLGNARGAPLFQMLQE